MEEKKMNIYEKLSCIQNEMQVPKNLFNSYGKYYYRNAETILETAKPICKKYRTTLVVSDDIREVSGRWYVLSTAKLIDWDSKEVIENHAFAREEENKKGMDASQVTGSCSSYARKYALNGLFNLDDVKDADSNEQKEETENKAQAKENKPAKTTPNEQKPNAQTILATSKQIGLILNLYAKNEIKAMLSRLKKNDLKELTIEEASKMIATRGGAEK